MAQQILQESAAPSTPAAGYVSVYAKSDGLVYAKDDAGLETLVSGSAALAGSASQAFSVGTATAAAHAVRLDQAPITSGTPAFSAYANTSPALANITWEKCVIDTEEFDTASAFDSATNRRFQPTVAGYYQINGRVAVSSSGVLRVVQSSIYKNGTIFKAGNHFDNGSGSASATNMGASVSCLIYLNGSSDYLELWAYGQSNSGTLTVTGGANLTYFNGCLVRAA